MKRVLMMATTAAMIEQFNKNNILLLLDLGYEVHVAGNFELGNPISQERLDAFKNWLDERACRYYHLPSTRNPLDFRNNRRACREMIKLIENYHYDFIHCHTPLGSVIARWAAHKTRTKIIYTAHGFHFYKGAPLKNWLFYFPVEYGLSRWTDVLVTITREDYVFAAKKMHAKKTAYVPGVGVETDDFGNVSLQVCMEYRRMLKLREDDIAILTVGELNQNKNQQLAVKAIAALQNPKLHYLLCGIGDQEENLRQLAESLGIKEQVHILGFRNDISAIYAACDIYCCTSQREGLNVSIMEAMASGLPCIVTKIRGNTDLVQDGKNGFHFRSDDWEMLSERLELLAEDRSLRGKLREENRKQIMAFSTEKVRERMLRIYRSMENQS